MTSAGRWSRAGSEARQGGRFGLAGPGTSTSRLRAPPSRCGGAVPVEHAEHDGARRGKALGQLPALWQGLLARQLEVFVGQILSQVADKLRSSLRSQFDGVAHQERTFFFRQVLRREVGDHIDSDFGCGAREVLDPLGFCLRSLHGRVCDDPDGIIGQYLHRSAPSSGTHSRIRFGSLTIRNRQSPVSVYIQKLQRLRSSPRNPVTRRNSSVISSPADWLPRPPWSDALAQPHDACSGPGPCCSMLQRKPLRLGPTARSLILMRSSECPPQSGANSARLSNHPYRIASPVHVSDNRCRSGTARWSCAKPARFGKQLSSGARQWRIPRDASLWLPARAQRLSRIWL